MARALFLGLPLHGHTNPTLPLVRELVARGDDVLYVSTPPFAARIEQTGARFRPYRNAFLEGLQQLPERLEELSWLLMRTTAEVLATELESFRAKRPDYLIVDSVAPWGQWVGEALGVPVVTSMVTFAINRHVMAYGASHGVRPKSARLLLSKVRHIVKALRLGRQLRRRHGLRGPGASGLVFGRSALNIVYTSRHFQPCADTFDHSYQFVGPSLSIAPEPAPTDPPTLYISLGTLFNADAGFYRLCFEALGDEPLQVILSLGDRVPAESLGPAPPNFLVRPSVAQLEVLQRASAFVTHGGMNSVSESLYCGVPVVVVPQMSEQQVVGRRVEELGAGLYLAKEAATASALRDCVRRLLAEDAFRRQADVVRQSFHDVGGVARAADTIQALVQGARPTDNPI